MILASWCFYCISEEYDRYCLGTSFKIIYILWTNVNQYQGQYRGKGLSLWVYAIRDITHAHTCHVCMQYYIAPSYAVHIFQFFVLFENFAYLKYMKCLLMRFISQFTGLRGPHNTDDYQVFGSSNFATFERHLLPIIYYFASSNIRKVITFSTNLHAGCLARQCRPWQHDLWGSIIQSLYNSPDYIKQLRYSVSPFLFLSSN